MALTNKIEFKIRNETETLDWFVFIPNVTDNGRTKRNKSKTSSIFSKGNAVEWPLQFMENENLMFTITMKEYYCPHINFTW